MNEWAVELGAGCVKRNSFHFIVCVLMTIFFCWYIQNAAHELQNTPLARCFTLWFFYWQAIAIINSLLLIYVEILTSYIFGATFFFHLTFLLWSLHTHRNVYYIWWLLNHSLIKIRIKISSAHSSIYICLVNLGGKNHWI